VGWHRVVELHVYGHATDIPPLLEAMRDLLNSEGNAKPCLLIWNALAHQGDIYPASFNAVPHIVTAYAIAPQCTSLQLAMQMRQPPAGLIVHTDRGNQYCSAQYQSLLTRYCIGRSAISRPINSSRSTKISLTECLIFLDHYSLS